MTIIGLNPGFVTIIPASASAEGAAEMIGEIFMVPFGEWDHKRYT